ncbi:MAG: hypothetical protein FWE03_04875 [Firmicutes bacterium]|nr:hypothetical protein [Bacillota bacterium]
MISKNRIFPQGVYRAIIALLMCAILTFVFLSDTARSFISIPSHDIAVAEDGSNTLVSRPNRPLGPQEEVYIMLEDVSRRTGFERYFFMSDGSVMHETFAEPIHFANEYGVYEKIDNSFVERVDDYGNKTLVNRSNSFQAEFSTDTSNTNIPLASITSGAHSLQFFPADQRNDLYSQEMQADNGTSSERSVSTAQIDSNYMTSIDSVLDFNYMGARLAESVLQAVSTGKYLITMPMECLQEQTT